MPAQDKKYGRTRRELLHEEYVEGSKRGGIGQPKDGFEVGFVVLLCPSTTSVHA